jgi:hypothetical protein
MEIKYFADIAGNKVSNVFVCESLEMARQIFPNCVEYTEENPARIGWIYDEATNSYFEPTVVEEQTE